MARKPDSEKHPIALWARDQRKAHGYPRTEDLADAFAAREGWRPDPGTLRQFEASGRVPSRPLTAALEKFYGVAAPSAGEEPMPSWARALDQKLDTLLTAVQAQQIADDAVARITEAGVQEELVRRLLDGVRPLVLELARELGPPVDDGLPERAVEQQ